MNQDYGAPPSYPSAPQPGVGPQLGHPQTQYNNELPPAYSAAPSNSIVGITGLPQVQQYTHQYMSQQTAGYQQYHPQGPVHGSFDAGARFSVNAPCSIPPPPPGVAPTAAQLAAMQGGQVIMSQEKGGFLGGSGSGGVTFW